MESAFVYTENNLYRTITIKKLNYGLRMSGYDDYEDSSIEEGRDDSYYFYDSRISKKIPIKREEFEHLWNELSALNFNKILLENNSDGCDGWKEGIALRRGFHESQVMLWCPDLNSFSKTEQPESFKFLTIMEQIKELAKKYNFKLNPQEKDYLKPREKFTDLGEEIK